MLKYLTQYLFQYRSVSIPQVGTLQVIQHPPQLNVVDKLILPPSFSVALQQGEDVSDHQLNFLNATLNKSKEDVLKDLQFFGARLHEKINGPGFTWEGLGTINRSTQSLPLVMKALEPVPAERVIRQDARHTVLVGDRERLSGSDADETVMVAGKKRSIFVVVGWILLLLSVLVIAFLLYTGKFRMNASGSKQSPSGHVIQYSSTQKA